MKTGLLWNTWARGELWYNSEYALEPFVPIEQPWLKSSTYMIYSSWISGLILLYKSIAIKGIYLVVTCVKINKVSGIQLQYTISRIWNFDLPTKLLIINLTFLKTYMEKATIFPTNLCQYSHNTSCAHTRGQYTPALITTHLIQKYPIKISILQSCATQVGILQEKMNWANSFFQKVPETPFSA